MLKRTLLSIGAALLAAACDTQNCPLPDNWVLGTALEPPSIPYTPKVMFQARELKPDQWTWRGSTVSFEELQRDLAVLNELNPKPLFLFEFAEGQSCRQLNHSRTAIAKVTKCSADGIPCIEGSIEELP